MNPNFDQAFHLLSVVRTASTSFENLEALHSTGLLSDLLRAKTPENVDREAFRRLLDFDPCRFPVKIGASETTDTIVTYLRAHGFQVHHWINQTEFPLVSKENPEDDEIQICDLNTDLSAEDGLALLRREGLSRPTYEHALRFALQYGTATTSTEKPFIVFLHEPWEDPNHDRQVMYIDRERKSRWLTLESIEAGFDSRCVLAGIRSRT